MSVLSQRGVNIEVLIIDDASTDNSAEVATELQRNDSRVKFLRHIKNKGNIATYNEGIEWVSGDYMLLLSADDYLLPEALSRAANLMNSRPEVGFTFGKAIDLKDNGTNTETKTAANEAVAKVLDGKEWRILEGKEFFKLIVFNKSINIVRTPTAIVRTDLQKQLGGYHPELVHSGDLEMWLRFAAHASVGVLGAYQAVYRLHGNNMQRDFYKEKGLADLQQRKAALDYVFQSCSHLVPDAHRFHKELFKYLGDEAVGYASHAFNDNEMELSERLSELALSICPEIRKSLPWTFLALKRCIGTRATHMLLPIAAWLRQAGIRIFNFGRIGRVT
jgi:glycosyltransferase involved in cell wall biosynthesis